MPVVGTIIGAAIGLGVGLLGSGIGVGVQEAQEEEYKAFIEGISNEVITWDYVSKTRKKNGFLKYASSDIALGTKKVEVISKEGEAPVMYGSNLCLNLNHIDKIPAFYNPPGARGEDTFFSTLLGNSKIVRIPVYHFHDGFYESNFYFTYFHIYLPYFNCLYSSNVKSE